MLGVLRKLYQARLLSAGGLYRLFEAMLHSGINLMMLLRFAARQYPDRIAVQDEREQISYKDLLTQTETLVAALQHTYGITTGQRVAIMCRNHASLIRALFAASRCGADAYLLNAEMSGAQFAALAGRHRFDLLVYDDEIAALVTHCSDIGQCIPAYHDSQPSIDSIAHAAPVHDNMPERMHFGKLIVLTSGTTGDFKTAERKPSVFNYLHPFTALINRLNLQSYNSVYIANPAYHGFGTAAILLAFALGVKVFMTKRFDAATACKLIGEHKIEALTLVPVMLDRMLKTDAKALNSLACIISGGAALNPALVIEVQRKLGDKLYNLYGTSEAGFCILATPQDLACTPGTLGKEIPGVRIRIGGPNNKKMADGDTGRICIKSSWAAKSSEAWIETGDLGFKDDNGYYYLQGRVDDMIVSGGENVYPIELEHILLTHEQISQVAVTGMDDEAYGQRLKAYVVAAHESGLTADELYAWLYDNAARYQIPKEIVVVTEIPYTATGKPDKKSLNTLFNQTLLPKER